MQRYGELNRSQAGGEVAASGTYAMDEKAAQLLGQGRELASRQLADVCRAADGVEQGVFLR
jgi:hypothetical protein